MSHDQAQPSVRENSSIKTILLVEHDAATLTLLSEAILQQTAHQLIHASDCLTMLKFLQFFKPHLIVWNEQLLTINGIDLSTRLQVMKELQTIPLLLFSTDPQSARSETAPGNSHEAIAWMERLS